MRLPTRHKLAIARVLSRLAVHCLPTGADPHRVRVHRGGIEWELDLTEGIDLSIYLLGSFERATGALVHRLLGPGDVAIDVGANIGAITLPMAQAVGSEGRVIAFEPTIYGVNRLRRACELNPWARSVVIAEQFVLGSGTTVGVTGAIPARWPLDRAPDPSTIHGGAVESIHGALTGTLDEYMESHRIGPSRLIKIDVDGAESNVIAGASRTIARFRPDIIVEWTPSVHLRPELRHSTEHAIHVLDGLGYRAAVVGRQPAIPLPQLLKRLRMPYGASANLHLSARAQ
jgi:FkbM family methyltransferase